MVGDYMWQETPVDEFLNNRKEVIKDTIYLDSPIFKKGGGKRNMSPQKDNSSPKKTKN